MTTTSRRTELARLEELILRQTGMDLARGHQHASLERFLDARLAALNLRNIDAYIDLLTTRPDELTQLIDAITVGLTWFFRDAEQLRAIGELMRRGHGKLRAWVAACVTGEDAYTVAALGRLAGRDIEVLGTDINTVFLSHAVAARYNAWSARQVPEDVARVLLVRDGDGFTVDRSLMRVTRFQRHNLMTAPPPGPFDLILCRNVLLYFRPADVTSTLARLAGALAPDGWLFLGSSEITPVLPPVLELHPIGARSGLRRRAQSSTMPLAILTPAPSLAVAPPPQKPAAPMSAPAKPAPPPPAPPPPAPPSIPALLSRAHALHRDGDLTDALELYAQVLALDPLSVEARLGLGLVYFKCGDALHASDALRAALFVAPALWPAAFYLALSCEKLGDVDGARDAYRRVVAHADAPLPSTLAGDIFGELDTWRREVVALARSRTSR
jgi:chemotaxis protein methyltransferase CheR